MKRMTTSSILVIIVATLIALTLISAMVGIALMASRNISLHAANATESVAGNNNNVLHTSNTSRHPKLPAILDVTAMAQVNYAKTSSFVSQNNMKQQTLSTPLQNSKLPAKVEVTTMSRVKHPKTSSENNIKQQTFSTQKSTVIGSKRMAFTLEAYWIQFAHK